MTTQETEIDDLSPQDAIQSIISHQELRTADNLDTVKETIYDNQNELTNFQLEVANMLEERQLSPEELGYLINEKLQTLHIGDQERNLIFSMLDVYTDAYVEVTKFSNEPPEAMFEAVFGRPPVGRVQVIKGSFSLHFRCENLDDYVFSSSGITGEIDSYTYDEIRRTGGNTCFNSCRIQNLKGLIVTENGSLPKC